MTLKEFCETNWHRGNIVKLDNGKEYFVKGVKGHGRMLLLYSEEYDKCFVADWRIVECRTSDYEEPDEVYLEKKRLHQEAAEAQRQAEMLERMRMKALIKQRNIENQERIRKEAEERRAAKRLEKQKLAEEKKESKAKAKLEAKQTEKEAEAVAKPKEKPMEKPVAKPMEKPVEKKAAKPEPKPDPKLQGEPMIKIMDKPEPAKNVTPAASATATGEQPKKKRKRITVAIVEKIKL